MASKVKIILLASTFIGGSLVKPDGEPILVDEAIAKDLCDRGVAYKDGERVQVTNSNGLEKLEAEIADNAKTIVSLTEQNGVLAKEVDELKAEIERLNALNVPTAPPSIVNKKLTGN